MILSPSILAADFKNLEQQIKEVENGGATYLHIDVMDGQFVPNISFGVPIIKSIRPITNMTFDVHLMIDRPSLYIEEFAKAGSDIITIHLESKGSTLDDLKLIKSKGIKSGLTIKPDTSIESVYKYLEYVDMILIMTVEPGFGGQKFIKSSISKIKTLKNYIDNNNLKIDIEVDGGINLDNKIDVLSAGANVLVAGSSVFKGNIRENCEAFLG